VSELHILSVAYGFAAVSADPAGGAEQVLAALDRALVDQGHRSTVIARRGSDTVGTLLDVPAADGDAPATRAAVHAAMRARIAEAVADGSPDLIHLHGLDFPAYLPAPGPPVLATLHLPLDWYPADALRPERPATYLQPVSADQAARAIPEVALLPPVPNGVDVDLYRPVANKADFALVLGRVAPEKGFHHALDAAIRADMPLRAAGTLFPYPAHVDYFETKVRPQLDARRRWVGPVAGAPKRRLLAEARCLLVPSTAAETSSLVAMEALASGTPVIAFRAGALPSIVEHGVTGFVVDTADGMADAISRIDRIDPAACRHAACTRFALSDTLDRYFDLYRRLAA
jgi:glycosyltransferase involved in cell wall biosynthesis